MTTVPVGRDWDRDRACLRVSALRDTEEITMGTYHGGDGGGGGSTD